MKRFITIILIGSFTLFCSCGKVKVMDTSIYIYKFKNEKDYSNNVPVGLSADKTKITSQPTDLNERWPVKLISGYYLNGTMGVNSGYLSLTIEEFNSDNRWQGQVNIDTLVIETDPYLEFYHRNDDHMFMNGKGAYGIDTAMINDLIRTNNLEKYFDRLK